jgi:hypothetical protein
MNKDCGNCGNRCMDMDMDPYCAAIKPWGRVLHRGKPAECGAESVLWVADERGKKRTPPGGDR